MEIKNLMAKDMKESLHSGRKPDISHMRLSNMVYVARACEYGNSKGYTRGNYMLGMDLTTKEKLGKYREYLRAIMSHTAYALDSIERYTAEDPECENELNLLVHTYAKDTDAKKDCSTGASFLPHIAGAAASVMMAIEVGVLFGFLPEDPGQPWVQDE